MSKLIVEVCMVEDVAPHPNADRMKIAKIKGWSICIGYDPETNKSQFQTGDHCIYIPYDAVLPVDLATGRLNVAKYCAPVKDADGMVSGYRVRAANLRGQKSFGVIMPIDLSLGDDPTWTIGTDVSDHFGITKWEPPLHCMDGDAEKPNPRFHTYTDIEKYANFPNSLTEGEEVVMTEKIHGNNLRHGYILDTDENGNAVWTWMAGSHAVRRKEYDAHGTLSKFWEVFKDNVKSLLQFLASDEFKWAQPKVGIICFGEVFGNQDMKYGLENGLQDVRYFDIAINGEYLDHDVKTELFKQFNVLQVPIIYRGPFNKEVLDQHTDGPTTVCDPNKAGRFKGREGVVVVPIKERHSPELNGRCIVKSVSVDYISRKNATDILE